MPDVVRLFLLIILWEPDDTMTQSIYEVPICPEHGMLAEQFRPRQESGQIKSWGAYCLPAKFEFLKGRNI